MAAEFLLYQHGPYRRVHLNLIMKFFVIGCADVLEEIERPRTAKSAGRIERRLNPQRLVGYDRNQVFARDQCLKLLVITNPRKVQAVDFRVLQKQRFMRWLEYRVPWNPADAVHPMITRRYHRPHGKCLAAHGQSSYQKYGALSRGHRQNLQQALILSEFRKKPSPKMEAQPLL